MVLTDDLVRDRLKKEAVDGRITCSRCIEIAEELEIDKNEIASTLTEMHIKIIQCQLGCFE